jgi:GDPmannose 4,6-dehydratase
MWLMLQQPVADDYVIGTGVTQSVREFVRLVFEAVDLDPEKYVVIDPQFYRPAEVDLLLADPTKAKKQLGWSPKVHLQQLAEMMVASDLSLIDSGKLS